MEQSIDEQIKALEAKRKEQNRVEAKANLVRVVGNKASTTEQLRDACYSFIGTTLVHKPRAKKVESTPSQ